MVSIRKVAHRSSRVSWGRPEPWDPTGAEHSKNIGRRIDAKRFLITVEARKHRRSAEPSLEATGRYQLHWQLRPGT